MATRDDELWLGTHRGDLTKIAKNSIEYFTQPTDSAKWIISSLEDQKGGIWFSTFGQGIFKYEDDRSERFVHYGIAEGLLVAEMEGMIEDEDGNIWAASWGGGVAKFDGKEFSHMTTKCGLISNEVISLFEDSESNLWFGTYGKGVVKFDGKQFATMTADQGLSNDIVRVIYEDKKGNMWFGTEGGGINILSNSKVLQYTLDESVNSNKIYSIQEDLRGHFWISTLQGLFQLVFEGSIEGGCLVRKFTKSDGLKNNSFLQNSMALDRNNRIWWGSESGLTTLDLNDSIMMNHVPNLMLTQIKFNQALIDFDRIDSQSISGLTFDTLSYFYNIPSKLVIPYDLNSISFEFAAIDWRSPHKIRYQHKLEGSDRSWSDVHDQTELTYRNLTSGAYRLLLRSKGEAGIWSEEVSFGFQILPPWWLSWTALVFYGLLGVSMTFQIWKFSRKRGEKKHQRDLELARLEEENKQASKISEQASKLEESLKILQVKNEEIVKTQNQLIQQEKMASLGQMAAGIAHEIKNPLNFITNFAQGSSELIVDLEETLSKFYLKFDKESRDEIEELLMDLKENSDDIYKHGSRLDRIVYSIMDHARGSEQDIRETNLHHLLDDNISLAYHGNRAKRPSFNLEVLKNYDERIDLVLLYPQDFGRVILNLLNNAFYAISEKQDSLGDDYKPILRITTKHLNEQIELRIWDNGPGISTSDKDKIFEPFFTTKPTGVGSTGLGLYLSYEIIVTKHQGHLAMSSELGDFTEFVITIPSQGLAMKKD